ncbi:MAG: hypothetical protein WC666_02280 [Candidatus Paceibacterota bacterium]|jgi:hypothetical protein
MKLNEETRAILKKEYPWLPALLDSEVYEFYVQVIDLNTLKITPWGEHVSSNQHWFVPWRKIHVLLLIDGKGKIIGKVGVRMSSYSTRCLTWKWPFIIEGPPKTIEYDFCETVENGLERISGAEETRYILHVANWVAVLHRLPKQCKVPLAQYLEEKREHELDSLRELSE